MRRSKLGVMRCDLGDACLPMRLGSFGAPEKIGTGLECPAGSAEGACRITAALSMISMSRHHPQGCQIDWSCHFINRLGELWARHGDRERHSSGSHARSEAPYSSSTKPELKRGSNMIRSDSSPLPYTYSDQPRAKARPAMVMPRLPHSQMLAILRESGVPENDARRWIEHDATLALDVSSSEG
jgi:hypothetical protein